MFSTEESDVKKDYSPKAPVRRFRLGPFRKVADYIRFIAISIRYYFRIFHTRFEFRPHSYAAFFSWNHHRSAKYLKKRFNPYSDSLSLLLKNKVKTLTFEQTFGGAFESVWSDHFDFSKLCRDVDFIRNFKGEDRGLPKIEIGNFRPYAVHFDLLGVNIEDGIGELETLVIDSGRKLERYKKILSLLSPQAAFLYCFYDIENLLIIKACNDLNIPVVELQHGRVKEHWAYEFLSYIPLNGRCWIPKNFWLWDEPSREFLESLGVKEFADIKVIGNPWAYLNQKGYLTEKDIRDRNAAINPTFVNVLVTLQGKGIPNFLRNAIEESDVNTKWHIRLHPRYKETAECMEFLDSKPEKIEWKNASERELYSILPKMDYHLTFYSVVCVEAGYFGIHNLVMDSLAVDAYGKDRENYSLVQSKEEILSHVNRKSDRFQKETLVDSEREATDGLYSLLN